MKTKVKANWLEVGGPREEYNSLENLLQHHDYIGFQPAGEDDTYRYMIVSDGPRELKGIAIRPIGRWCGLVMQKNIMGNYYIFSTAAELFEWMKG